MNKAYIELCRMLARALGSGAWVWITDGNFDSEAMKRNVLSVANARLRIFDPLTAGFE
jgi:hypothetical protein